MLIKLASSYSSVPVLYYQNSIVTISCSYLAYPFLIQHSLVNDILSKVVKNQIDEELSAINNNLDQLNDKKEEYIISLKKNSSSETTLEVELDKQSLLYWNLNEEIEKVKKRKAKLEEVKDDKQYISKTKSLYKDNLFTLTGEITRDRDTKIKLFDSDCIKKRTKKELTHYIQQLSDDHVQKIFSKFMDRDLQKKLKKVDRAETIKCHSVWIGAVIGSTIVESLFIYLVMKFSNMIEPHMIEPFIVYMSVPALVLGAILGIGLFFGTACAYAYCLNRPPVEKQLENIREELDSDYQKSHSNLKPSPEEEPKSKVETTQNKLHYRILS